MIHSMDYTIICLPFKLARQLTRFVPCGSYTFHWIFRSSYLQFSL